MTMNEIINGSVRRFLFNIDRKEKIFFFILGEFSWFKNVS